MKNPNPRKLKMSKNRSHSLNTTLPQHIILQVLYRAPVKSLVRFSCVSKYWYFLISNPIFIRNHLYINTIHNNNLIIFNATARNHTDSHICLLSFTQYPISVLRIDNAQITGNILKDYCSKISFDDFSKNMVLAGSINGIVCCSHSEELFGRCVALWNPAIKYWKPIALRGLRTVYDKWEFMSVGFAFDAKSDDYKIVLIIPVVVPPDFKKFRWSRVEIYSVKRGYWRNVEGGQGTAIPFWPKFRNCNFIVNGVPYWVGHDERLEDMEGFDPYQQEILGAFDPCTGVYKKVPYPAFVKNEGTYVHPVKYRDSVAALIQSPGQCPNSMVDLYVLDDNSSDWTKIYTIGPFSFKKLRIPQCFNTGELILKTWAEKNTDGWNWIPYYCDPKTNCVLPASEFDTIIPLWYQSYNHVESLVCVKGMQLIGNEDVNKKAKPRKKTWTESLSKDFESVLRL